MYEVEVRAKINADDFEEKITSLNLIKKSESLQLDTYYKFSLDVERKLVLRIRETPDEVKLTFKGSSKLKEDIAWQEWETSIKDSYVLKKLLLSNGMEVVVKINKSRSSYKIDDFEVNFDHIEELGDFIEVQLMSDDAEQGARKVKNFMFEKLGISEKDIITKGYVPLMLEMHK